MRSWLELGTKHQKTCKDAQASLFPWSVPSLKSFLIHSSGEQHWVMCSSQVRGLTLPTERKGEPCKWSATVPRAHWEPSTFRPHAGETQRSVDWAGMGSYVFANANIFILFQVVCFSTSHCKCKKKTITANTSHATLKLNSSHGLLSELLSFILWQN